MNWELRVRKHIKKTLSHFPKKVQRQIVLVLRELIQSPYSEDIVKIAGEENIWRRRVGSYRIFYEIFPKDRMIYVFRIERRTSKTY